jgi:hypothetical protein
MLTKLRLHLACHPATAVLLWLFFMVWLMDKPSTVLIGASILVAAGFNRATWVLFVRYVRRSRWLLVIMCVAHAYSLPGAPLLAAWAVYSPSAIGVVAGLMQSWRLMLVLALLAVLMTRLTRASLLLGIYSLTRYVCWFGCSSERIAARIALTLGYADELMTASQQMSWQQRLQLLRQPPVVLENDMSIIEIKQRPLVSFDYVCLLTAVLLWWLIP